MLAHFTACSLAAAGACVSHMINGAYFEVALAFFFFAFLGCCALFFADICGILRPIAMQLDFMVHMLAQIVKAAHFHSSLAVSEHVYAFIVRAGQAAGDGAATAFVPGMLFPGILVSAAARSTAGLRCRQESECKQGRQNRK